MYRSGQYVARIITPIAVACIAGFGCGALDAPDAAPTKAISGESKETYPPPANFALAEQLREDPEARPFAIVAIDSEPARRELAKTYAGRTAELPREAFESRDDPDSELPKGATVHVVFLDRTTEEYELAAAAFAQVETSTLAEAPPEAQTKRKGSALLTSDSRRSCRAGRASDQLGLTALGALGVGLVCLKWGVGLAYPTGGVSAFLGGACKILMLGTAAVTGLLSVGTGVGAWAYDCDSVISRTISKVGNAFGDIGSDEPGGEGDTRGYHDTKKGGEIW